MYRCWDSETKPWLTAALSALRRDRAVTSAAAESITKAKDLADLFKPALISVLARAQRTAQRLSKPHQQPHTVGRNLDDIRALDSDLCNLIEEMTQEAALVGVGRLQVPSARRWLRSTG